MIVSSSKGSRPIRKIEQQMNDAITASKDWQCDNTMVTNADGVSFVFLYGNCIAQVGDNYIRMFDGGYRSATTKSRLNAILNVHGCNFDGVFQKKGEWFFHDSYRSIDLPFENGMVVS